MREKNTVESYGLTLGRFQDHFGTDRELPTITSEEILSFLAKLTEGRKQLTRHGRYSHFKAFFNFIKANLDPASQNPCDVPMLRKLYRPGKPISWSIVEKETVDEIIFRTTKVRNRIMLELMARGGMRIGEVLNLTPKDIADLKFTIQNPKSGKDEEIVFIPIKVAEWLRGYITSKGIQPDKKVFPITYAAARMIVRKAGELVGIELRPHDLRRHAATYASRSGVPIEIVSKIILWHANLSTTQRYLERSATPRQAGG